ncbi:metal-dependent hydrolase [Actinokineospora auranticolor]|uniref:LexA-binding, inner membrane-associated putative hydrolase n=1 Tax=Actinokineospora auranticolor TaxID=155976 RepID=A0A2S6GWV1_9PSEU|nr:metal-dependent hydrolase [Actinokineospora auranticolor]PPK69678.1 LexA-binding, inner membrane-associated putative hydrolase [Actinokineospora auranticolor]
MSTGPTHAMSGLTAWATVTALTPDNALGQLSTKGWLVGAVLAAGAALLPDLDHPESTVSSTFGPVSQAGSKLINTISHGVYRLTRTKRDSNRDGGHRGLTHTLFFAVLATVVTTAIIQTSRSWALPVLMFFFCGLAVRGIMHKWCPRNDALWITGTALLLTYACLKWTDQTDANAAACGLAVGIGCVAHYLGDAITEQGCPILWPVPIAWKTWYPVAPPKVFRMRTGGRVEMAFVGPLLTVVAVWMSLIALRNTGALPMLRDVPLTWWGQG